MEHFLYLPVSSTSLKSQSMDCEKVSSEKKLKLRIYYYREKKPNGFTGYIVIPMEVTVMNRITEEITTKDTITEEITTEDTNVVLCMKNSTKKIHWFKPKTISKKIPSCIYCHIGVFYPIYERDNNHVYPAIYHLNFHSLIAKAISSKYCILQLHIDDSNL